MQTCVLCAVEGVKRKAYKGKYCEKHWEKEKTEKRLTYIPLRDTWYTMIGKCTKPHWGIYKYYGAKGFSVCEEWQNRDNFISWAKSQGYRFGMKIGILPGAKVFSPENCFVEDRNKAKNSKKSEI